MNIRQLQCFLAICESMNYTHAAEQLFLSRQALKHMLSTLEAEVGEPLFSMEKNKLEMTARARSLRDKAAPVVAAFEELERTETSKIPPVHSLSLACDEALFPLNLAPIEARLHEFEHERSDIRFDFDELPLSAVLHRLDTGMANLGLALTAPTLLEGYDVLPVYRGTWAVYLNRHNPLAEQPSVKIEALAPMTLLVENEQGPRSWTHLLEQALSQAGCTEAPHIEHAASETVIRRVREDEGVGFGFMSSQTFSTPRSTCHVPLEDQGISPAIVFIKRAGEELPYAEKTLWMWFAQA